ncbi:MAG: protein TonB [Sphingobacteriales bacterium]|jgi:protein TonB
MELKKKPEVDLHNKRSLFLQIGLAVAMLLVLLAFEWKSFDKRISSLGELVVEEVEQEIIPITEQPKKPPPPPPPPAPLELEVVEDDAEIEEVEIKSTEVDEDTRVEIIEAPAPEENTNEQEVFTIVENMPEFPGGEAAMRKYIGKNIKYPNLARENKVEGTVYIQFVINQNGEISDVKILRGIGAGCDEEALRVIKKMPAWAPGKQRGKPVRVQFTLPVKFKLS